MTDRRSRLAVDGTHNLREVAPGTLRPGRLYRSDALDRLTPEGRRAVAALGLRLVVDLRSELDRRIGGPDLLEGVGARYLAIPIEGVGHAADPAALDLRTVYRWILGREGERVGEAVRAVADADGPVLVHCTAGKDRTGLVCALVLAALGVDGATIADDYTRTGANLAGEWTDRMVGAVRRLGVPVTDALVEVLAGSPGAVLRDTFDWLAAERGGVRAYLRTVGVGDDVVARLRAALLPGVAAPTRPDAAAGDGLSGRA